MGTRRPRVSVNSDRSKLVKWDDLDMEIISNSTQDEIKRAANALIDGHLVAFPTETVYGLGADATNEKAVSRIYSVKGRPTGHPLIVHISSIKQLENWAKNIPDYAIKLAREFWPGPITLILRRSPLAKDFITGGQSTVGLRAPANPIAQELLAVFESLGGSGIAAPSANRFGAVSATSSDDVMDEIGSRLNTYDLVINGGSSRIGIESTIVDCTRDVPSVLRPGAITGEMIENCLSTKLFLNVEETKTKFSGSFKSHYSPNAQVKLSGLAQPGDGFIALSKIATPSGAIRLASPKDVDQYAAQIYSALRLGDTKGLKTIVVIPPEGSGLEVAIADRITKAASKIFTEKS
jgi:L-threonylcarbamoyladenylate synthase